MRAAIMRNKKLVVDEMPVPELGPGEVLAGLVGRIRKGTEVLSIADCASLEKALPILRAAVSKQEDRR